jgi:integrase/recombinase XerD
MTTNEEIVEKWLYDRPPNTRATYERTAKRLLKSLNGKHLKDATLKDLQSFSRSLENDDRIEQNSRSHYLTHARSLFKFAFLEGDIPSNPSQRLRVPKVNVDVSARVLQKSEVEAILNAAPTDYERFLFAFIYHTGLRISEMCDLKWKNVRKNEGDDRARLTIVGKGSKQGYILIEADYYNYLRSLNPVPKGNDYVFHHPRPRKAGGRLNRFYMDKLIKKIGSRAGVSGASCHRLRHSHASHSLEAGATLVQIKEQLRHSNLSTTSIYSHAAQDSSSGQYVNPTFHPTNGPPDTGSVPDSPANP